MDRRLPPLPRPRSSIASRRRSLEAEQWVLGSLLMVPELCDEVSLIARADDFYSDANQKVYAHLLDMHNSGGRIDHCCWSSG